jgi:hypothetical protein
MFLLEYQISRLPTNINRICGNKSLCIVLLSHILSDPLSFSTSHFLPFSNKNYTRIVRWLVYFTYPLWAKKSNFLWFSIFSKEQEVQILLSNSLLTQVYESGQLWWWLPTPICQISVAAEFWAAPAPVFPFFFSTSLFCKYKKVLLSFLEPGLGWFWLLKINLVSRSELWFTSVN